MNQIEIYIYSVSTIWSQISHNKQVDGMSNLQKVWLAKWLAEPWALGPVAGVGDGRAGNRTARRSGNRSRWYFSGIHGDTVDGLMVTIGS
jgi:hypothetical protein